MTIIALSLLVIAASPATPESALSRGAEALAAFKPDEALPLLERARAEGPYPHRDYVRLFEQLAIAHAYLGQAEAAQQLFDQLLTIEPRHLISYTLSPKVTFVFERARRAAEGRLPSALELRWPSDTFAQQPLSLEVATVGNAEVAAIELWVRRRGEPTFTSLTAPLVAGLAHFDLPGLPQEGSLVRELYAVALDAAGNEVLQAGLPTAPRTITLTPDTRPRWYQRWWVWAVGAVVVGATAAATVYGLTRPPPATLPATVDHQGP